MIFAKSQLLDYVISLCKSTWKVLSVSLGIKHLKPLPCDHQGPRDQASHHFSEFVSTIFPNLILLRAPASLHFCRPVKPISASGCLYMLFPELQHFSATGTTRFTTTPQSVHSLFLLYHFITWRKLCLNNLSSSTASTLSVSLASFISLSSSPSLTPDLVPCVVRVCLPSLAHGLYQSKDSTYFVAWYITSIWIRTWNIAGAW